MKVKHFVKCIGNHTPLRIEYLNFTPLYDNADGTDNIYTIPKWIMNKKINEIRTKETGFLICIKESTKQ